MSLTIDQNDRILPSQDNVAEQETKGKFKVFVTRGRVFWLLFKMALLSILTLGIYRFWGKTNLRRYLWSAVEYAGDRFEYHGTAKELFIGFLIALAVLLPIGVLNQLLQIYIFAEGGYEAVLGIYSLVFMLFILFLIHFAVYRMRRYQLTRTSWRSIRFGLEGAASKYAVRSILWSFFATITAGIAYPWMYAWQVRRIIKNARFGSAKFNCTISGGDVFKRYVMLYGVNLVYLGLLAYVGYLISQQQIPGLGAGLALGGMILVAMIVYLIFRLSVLKAVINRTTIDGHEIKVAFNSGKLVWVGFLSGIVTLLIQLAFVALAGFIFYMMLIGGDLQGQNQEQMAQLAMAMTMPAFIVGALIANAVGMAIFGVSLMRTIIPAIAVDHSEALENVLQSQQSGPRHGEGFADALDVGAF